ncbi:ATP-binding protein [Vannielia litorea]|uniref:histidine kinase n=1 Tax=Vannielia litorea TaxID=1217970 RepID=A0A1N6ELW7_9RHOB|nr:ATP-binding protein [Vannielia litorea]SIN84014.1 PAS domain S-box-containing protein [Vannielia litorea]
MNELNKESRGTRGDAGYDHDAALRRLFFLSLDPDIDFATKVEELLTLGCETLGLELGIVSRIRGATYSVEHVSGADWAPEVGATFDVTRTYCTHTLMADDVVHFHHAGMSRIAEHPCYVDFGLESYIGVPIRAGKRRVGTLNFSAPATRAAFTEDEAELVRLFGRWLGEEWLKHERSRELADKTRLLNAIVESVPDAVVAVNRDREIEMVNTAAEQILGYDRKELIGKTTAFLYPDDAQFKANGERIFRKAEKTTIDHFDVKLRRKDGRVFPAEVFMSPLRDDDDELLGIVGVMRDITDQKALDRAREELISTVTHELRTPITSANGAVKLLTTEKARLSPVLQPTLEIAARNLDRLMRLVEDILVFEQLSSRSSSTERRPLKLGALLEMAAEDIRPFAMEHGITISVVPGDSASQTIRGDRHRLLQVLSNLLSNAIKASHRGSTVEVGLRRGGLGFWVRDYGKGIPDSLQPNLFERFSRAPQSYVEGHSGTGLGMGIVKEIVDQHEGDITFQTSVGAGTEFLVSFPATAIHAAE